MPKSPQRNYVPKSQQKKYVTNVSKSGNFNVSDVIGKVYTYKVEGKTKVIMLKDRMIHEDSAESCISHSRILNDDGNCCICDTTRKKSLTSLGSEGENFIANARNSTEIVLDAVLQNEPNVNLVALNIQPEKSFFDKFLQFFSCCVSNQTYEPDNAMEVEIIGDSVANNGLSPV